MFVNVLLQQNDVISQDDICNNFVIIINVVCLCFAPVEMWNDMDSGLRLALGEAETDFSRTCRHLRAFVGCLALTSQGKFHVVFFQTECGGVNGISRYITILKFCKSSRQVGLCVVKYLFNVVFFRFVAMGWVTYTNKCYILVIHALDLE